MGKYTGRGNLCSADPNCQFDIPCHYCASFPVIRTEQEETELSKYIDRNKALDELAVETQELEKLLSSEQKEFVEEG